MTAEPSVTRSRTNLRSDRGVIATAAVLGTTVALAPHLFRDGDAFERDPRFMPVVWLGLLLLGPVAAAVAARLRPVVRTTAQALSVGLPQLAVVLVMIMVDQWLEVRSGYILSGSGEVAMAFTFGAGLAIFLGSVLGALVAGAARWGTVAGAAR